MSVKSCTEIFVFQRPYTFIHFKSKSDTPSHHPHQWHSFTNIKLFTNSCVVMNQWTQILLFRWLHLVHINLKALLQLRALLCCYSKESRLETHLAQIILNFKTVFISLFTLIYSNFYTSSPSFKTCFFFDSYLVQNTLKALLQREAVVALKKATLDSCNNLNSHLHFYLVWYYMGIWIFAVCG